MSGRIFSEMRTFKVKDFLHFAKKSLRKYVGLRTDARNPHLTTFFFFFCSVRPLRVRMSGPSNSPLSKGELTYESAGIPYSVTISLAYDITDEQYKHYCEWVEVNTVCGIACLELGTNRKLHIQSGFRLPYKDTKIKRRLTTAFKTWDGITGAYAVKAKVITGKQTWGGVVGYCQKEGPSRPTFVHRIGKASLAEGVEEHKKFRQLQLESGEKEVKLSIHNIGGITVKYAQSKGLKTLDETLEHMWNIGKFNWAYMAGKVNREFLEMYFKKHALHWEHSASDIWGVINKPF